MAAKLPVDELVERLDAQYDGLVKRPGYGELALFYNPLGLLPAGLYFASFKTQDGHTIGPRCLTVKEYFASRLGCRFRHSSLFLAHARRAQGADRSS